MTYDDYKELEMLDPYYKGRWHYYKMVVDLLQRLSFDTCLELGPYKKPMVQGADVIDKDRHLGDLTYEHDANLIPWPVRDGQYDLFIALQVWEHLERKREAFEEVRRIAKMAVLSFPLNWYCPGNLHHGITEEKIAEWTNQTKPTLKFVVRGWNVSLKGILKKSFCIKRLICLYDFR